MDELRENIEEVHKPYKPYTYQLAKNIQNAFPLLKVTVGHRYITLNMAPNKPNELKTWLYTMLESLPEIEHPLERIEFIINVNDVLEKVILINPSEMDVQAFNKAIIDELNFSQPPAKGWNVPMPLDHPWYSDKDYFKKNGSLKEYASQKKNPKTHSKK